MALTWHWRATGEPLYVSTAAGALTLGFAGRSNLSFDGAGRLVGAWLDGITYRRALDNRVLAKWLDPDRPGLRRRRLLADEERQALIRWAYDRAAEVAAGLAAGQLDLAETPPTAVEPVARWLTVVQSWSWPTLEEEARRFHAIYKPVSILPPDQYLAVVLQATEGCSYNRCTFCTFYRDRPFRIKSPDEFAEHCRQVRAFFGAGLPVRRTLFLADANAVIIPQTVLLPMLETAHRYFQEQGSKIYAFISAPDALRKTAADFAAMGALNVRRLYVGLETGHDPLRTFLAKPGLAGDVLEAVRMMKAGGLAVGVIAMVGVGGQAFREDHFRATVDLVRRMPLGRGDLIYLSPFVSEEESPYAAEMRRAGLAPMDEDMIRAEELRFKVALSPWAAEHDLRVSHYDVREFIY